MEFIKVYRAKVESVRQHYISPTGIREFEIWFNGGKRMFYNRSQKQSMVIAPGTIIRFTAYKVEPDLYWVIDEVLEVLVPTNKREIMGK